MIGISKREKDGGKHGEVEETKDEKKENKIKRGGEE